MGKEVKKGKVEGRKFIKWGLAFCFINFLLVTFNCVAQSDTTFKYKGILRGTANFALGDMPQNKITNAYLTGNLEYYADSKISIRGDLYLFLNSLTKNSVLKNNDALYFGAFYHFLPNRHFDPLLGFQPGISQTQFIGDNGTLEGSTICPLTSFMCGFNYYAEQWFHFQLNIRYTIGEHVTTGDETNISEISFNFGLGFNINALKKKK
ncbi:MAG TPA: hypothetical protein VK809_13170 [Bacteroidia bacterium]|jgi:hypothetical protein|nr:hypothetical protein [Bacteroidia bacterium]